MSLIISNEVFLLEHEDPEVRWRAGVWFRLIGDLVERLRTYEDRGRRVVERTATPSPKPMVESEVELFRKACESAGWSNRRVGEALGISSATVARRAEEYGINWVREKHAHTLRRHNAFTEQQRVAA